MNWGTIELEPEVRDWLEGLPTSEFATAAFYVDLLAERGPLLGEPYTRQLDGKLRVPPAAIGDAGDVLDSARPAHRDVDGVPEDPDAGETGDRACPSGAAALHVEEHVVDEEGK